MTTVICFGTFDILHPGHLNYFKQAKEHGNILIVVVARDRTKEKQNKELIFNENERLDLIKNLQLVGEAVLGDLEDHFKIIKEKNPDVICLGYDHKISEQELAEKLLEFGLKPKIIRAKPYKEDIYKSSKIKNLMKN